MNGTLLSCTECAERGSRYAEWTCGECEDTVAERVAAPVWRALLWKRLFAAGYPVKDAGLDYWELLFLAMIEERGNER